MVKKLLTIFVITVIVALSFSGCETAKNNNSTVTETQTRPKNANENKLETLKINDEIFSDIYLTYPEISEKRGELIGFCNPSGGQGYSFKNGFGTYVWTSPTDYDTPIANKGQMSTDGNWILSTVWRPKDDAVCRVITDIPLEKFFKNIKFPANINEIEKISGVTEVTYATDNFGPIDYFCSGFIYKDMKVIIATPEMGIIDSASFAEVWHRSTDNS